MPHYRRAHSSFVLLWIAVLIVGCASDASESTLATRVAQSIEGTRAVEEAVQQRVAATLTASAKPSGSKTTPTPVASKDFVQGKILSTQGGELNYVDAIRVRIPPRALSADQTVSITRLAVKPSERTKGLVIPGDTYEINAKQDFFATPIDIVIQYNPALLPKDRSEGEIFGVFLYERQWLRMLGDVDREKNTLTLHSVHASTWSWAYDDLSGAVGSPYSTAMNCIKSIADPLEVPKTLSEAYKLKDRRLQEWKDTIDALKLNLGSLDESLQKRLHELGFEWTTAAQEETVHISTEMLAEKLSGAHIGHTVVVRLANTVVGVYLIANATWVSLKTSMLSGEVLAGAVKVQAAQQRYMAAKAYVYMLENPDAKSVPPEYMIALLATCSEIPQKSSVPTSGKCAWTKILFGTWKSRNNDLITFSPDGTGLSYHRGDKNNVTPFEWTCLENGIFKSLTGGSEYQLVFPDKNTYIMNGDPWTRTTGPP